MSIDPDLVELAKLEVKELLGQRLGDMRGLIIRLARALKKASPGNELSGQALDYLARNGMGPNPLRDNAALTDGADN